MRIGEKKRMITNIKLLLIIPFAILAICVYEIVGSSTSTSIIILVFLIYCLYVLISTNLEERRKNGTKSN